LQALSPAQQQAILEDEQSLKEETAAILLCAFGWATLFDGEGDKVPENHIIYAKEKMIVIGDIIELIKTDEDTTARMKMINTKGFKMRLKHGEDHKEATSGNKSFAKHPARQLESWDMGVKINGMPTAIILIYPKTATPEQEKIYIERFDKIRHKTMEAQSRKIKEIIKKEHEAEKRRARIKAEEEKKRGKGAEKEGVEISNASGTTRTSSFSASESSESEEEEEKNETPPPQGKAQQEKGGSRADTSRGSKRKPTELFAQGSKILGGTYQSKTPATVARPGKTARSGSRGSPGLREGGEVEEEEENYSYTMTPEEIEEEKERRASLTEEQREVEDQTFEECNMAFVAADISGPAEGAAAEGATEEDEEMEPPGEEEADPDL
jgi:hypothetical protein